MTVLRPFFLLIGRASVLWIGAFTLLWMFVVVVGLTEPEARTALFLDAGFIGTLGLPAAAGWLFGLVIQEFQHTSIAHQLPGAGARIAPGFLATGLGVTIVTAVLLSRMDPPSLSFPLTLVLGFCAYCAAGTLVDPLSSRITILNAIAIFLLVGRSSDLARVAAEQPWPAVAIALAAAAWGLHRLFARSTFRRKPFRPTKPLPGSFSLERSQVYERQKKIRDRSRGTGWRAGYLGANPWNWVRAAFHEAYGGLGWKAVLRAVSATWGLGLLILIYAWIDKGEYGYVEAIGRSLYDALFRSPHVPQFGKEGGPYLMVLIVISAAAIVTALQRPVALNDALPHPLSRFQRARVAFRGGLVDVAIFMVGAGLAFFAAGHAIGLLLGFEPRFDFMPFYFRALMVTLILLPLGHWGRLALHAASRRKAENTVVALVFGVVGFVVATFAGVMILPVVFVSPLAELAVLVLALLASQLIYRSKLATHYRSADLA